MADQWSRWRSVWGRRSRTFSLASTLALWRLSTKVLTRRYWENISYRRPELGGKHTVDEVEIGPRVTLHLQERRIKGGSRDVRLRFQQRWRPSDIMRIRDTVQEKDGVIWFFHDLGDIDWWEALQVYEKKFLKTINWKEHWRQVIDSWRRWTCRGARRL